MPLLVLRRAALGQRGRRGAGLHVAIRVSKRHSAIRRAGASAWTAHCRPPGAAIPSNKDAISLEAAIAMRARFAQDSPSVRVLFDALVKLLTGVGQKH